MVLEASNPFNISKVFNLNDARNMKTISKKQLRLDIYSANLIQVKLVDFASWPESARLISVLSFHFLMVFEYNQGFLNGQKTNI